MKKFSLGSYFMGILVVSIFMGILTYSDFENIKEEKDKLQEEHNILQTQYDRDLSTCRTLLSDLQERVQQGEDCYVDGGLNCE